MWRSRVLKEAKRRTLFFSSKSFGANALQFLYLKYLLLRNFGWFLFYLISAFSFVNFCRVEKRESPPFLLCVAWIVKGKVDDALAQFGLD